MAELDSRQIETALQQWHQGDHAGAVTSVTPAADAGDRQALVLLAWFQSQRGEPHWRAGVQYAEEAVGKGLPFVANYYVSNMLMTRRFGREFLICFVPHSRPGQRWILLPT